MTDYPRYAIYFVPAADSALYSFGASIVGYDSYRSEMRDFAADVIRNIDNWSKLTADPRKYGFHATLKAPFPLRTGIAESELRETLYSFAATPRAVPHITPVVRAIGDFVAIVPNTADAALSDLANNCVTAFDSFRAPMTSDDRARRNPEKLSNRQVQQLDKWGYPYVFDDFRFHMTLTGRIPAEQRNAVLEALRDGFSRLTLSSVAIDRIALCRQSGRDDRFSVIETFRLGSWVSAGPGLL